MMTLHSKLLLSLTLAICVNSAHAQLFSVAAEFWEPVTFDNNPTLFNGTFEWDGLSVTDLKGTMNSSMYPVDPTGQNGGFPLMSLTYQLGGTSISGNIVSASVFLRNSTDVYRGGGYDGMASEFIKYGGGITWAPKISGETPNENAFFTLVFDKTTMKGIVDQMVYGDCTQGGLMGNFCMAGEITGSSPMFAYPLNLNITPASVPLPAAVWLFGGVLAGFVRAEGKRRKRYSV